MFVENRPIRSEADDAHSDSPRALKRRVTLYEWTLGAAVLPVLVRRLAITVARAISNLGHTRQAEIPTERLDPRVWVEAGSAETGRFRMFLDPSSPGHGADQMALGTYDQPLIEALRPFASLEGAVIWDVGAHVGYESLCFAELVGPSGQVVAFEPNPANAQEWQRNVDGNPSLASRMSLQRLALSDASGDAMFCFSEDVAGGLSSGSHLANVTPPEEQTSYTSFGSLKVTCARVDDLVEAGEIDPPAMIKIDVEGAEADVLRGALRTLERHQPALLVEVHHIHAMHDVDEILRDAGYSILLLDSPEECASRCFLKAVPARSRVRAD